MLFDKVKSLFSQNPKINEKDTVSAGDEVIKKLTDDFERNETITTTVNQHIRTKLASKENIIASSKKAFAHFSPTRIGSQVDNKIKSKLGYVTDTEEFKTVQTSIVDSGLKSIRDHAENKKGIEISLTKEMFEKLELEPTKEIIKEFELDREENVNNENKNDDEKKFSKEISFKNAWQALDEASPGYDFSKGKSILDECTSVKYAKQMVEQNLDREEGEEQDDSTEAETTSSETQPPNDTFKDKLNDLVQTMTTPENQVMYDVSNRAEQSHEKRDIDEVTSSFSLRPGPADVTAFHDFFDLQIAFQHVWTEIFDKELKVMGEWLYALLVDWRTELGVQTDTDTITSVDQLRQLIADVRKAALQIAEQDSRLKKVITLVPELTTEVWTHLTETQKNSLYDLVISDELIFDYEDACSNKVIYTEWLRNVSISKLDQTTRQETARAILRTVELLPAMKSRVEKTLEDLEQRLAQKYRFDVFYTNPEEQKYSINFGILVNYRQRWQPLSYQVGELVSTIPLAPKETQKYTTRHVFKKSRAEKEIENALQVRRQESTDTSRSHAEIVRRANNKTNFKHTSEGGVNFKIANAKGSNGVSIDSAKQSAQTKKDFREAVTKAAEEYKNDHRMELSTSESEETVDTTSGEITNPNEEIPVTYMFYELQRRYEVSEQIHKITPVVMVANPVPRPDEIDEEWLISHDWILRRVILDDSFLLALDYLSESFVGDEIASNVQRENLYTQIRIVERLSRQIKSNVNALQAARTSLDRAVENYARTKADNDGGILGGVGSFLWGSTDYSETNRIRMEAARDAFERTEREQQDLLNQMSTETTALQQASDKYSQVMQEQMNKRTEILRLRTHVKDNIIYYMQAIWDQEPEDQRFFRLYDVDIIDITGHLESQVTMNATMHNPFDDVLHSIHSRPRYATFTTTIPSNIETYARKLVEVADLDNLLGYKGNYMIFPLKQNNPVTLYMMQDYLRLDESLHIKDPDQLGNFSIEELLSTLRCLHDTNENKYNEVKPKIEQLIIKKLSNPNNEKDVVIVPTGSLYIEALPGSHPILEDFKLIHRAVDVKKAQAEVRQEELENLRKAARTLGGDYDDPDIDRKIVVEGTSSAFNVNTDD